MLKRIGQVFVMVCFLAALVLPVQAQGPAEAALVQQTIDRMTPEERVGQLFMVTFAGADVGASSEIAQLIREYRVGGVVLSPANGNIRNEGDTPRRVAELTNALQSAAFAANSSNAVPLFIAVMQEGDSYPMTALRQGFTPLPAPMALGATWRESSSLAVGRIVGQELAAVGVNMLLGPSLDVLSVPRPNQSGDLGLRAFGGDPNWVGRHGRAYIQGVHQGSVARVLTIAGHFPGIGSSDRSPDDEVATVDRAMNDLRRADLAPFMLVTSGSLSASSVTTDGLLSAHVRYRALQGAINQATRPISVDAQGLQALLGLPEFGAWRDRGILVSDALGLPAIRKSYDPQQLTFNQRSIARDAFLAGNDVLYLARFGLTDTWPEQLANTKATIEFFREQYRTDKTFKERVDRSLRRILLLKRRLYTTFTPASVLIDAQTADERVGRDEATVAGIARDAITLVSPNREEIAVRLPRPTEQDQILIVTDARVARECATCPTAPLLSPTAIQDTILRLYGPTGTGLLAANRVESITLADLKVYLTPGAGSEETRKLVDSRLRTATWLVFAFLDTNTAEEASADALRLFLRDRRDLFRDKRIIALAHGAPYYLDATEISKLTAYYAVYGKTVPFIEASVRALFQEFVPQGALPVSVPGTNYDLATFLEPDPAQPITLNVANKTAGDKVQVGETLTVRSGPILDRNGHAVPDYTLVNFTFFYRAEAAYLRPQEVTTRDGVAEATFLVERPGQLEITAKAGRAETRAPLILAAQGEGAVTATPSPRPTATSTPTVTPTMTAVPTATPTPIPISAPPPPPEPDWDGLGLSLVTMLLVGGVGLVAQGGIAWPPAIALRLVLLSLTWGLVGYLLHLVGLGPVLRGNLAGWDAPLVSAVFAILPAAWEWVRRR